MESSPSVSMRLLPDNPQPSASSPLLDAASPAVHYDHSFVAIPSSSSSSSSAAAVSSSFSSASSLFASAFGVPGVTRGSRGVDGAAYHHLNGAALPLSYQPASYIPGEIVSGISGAASITSIPSGTDYATTTFSSANNATTTAATATLAPNSSLSSFPYATSSSSSSSAISMTKRNSTAIMKEEPEEPQLVSSDCKAKKESKKEVAKKDNDAQEEEEEGEAEENHSNGEISQFTEVPLTGK